MSLNNITQVANQVDTTTTKVDSTVTVGASSEYAFFGYGTFNPAVTGNVCYGLYMTEAGYVSAVLNDTGTYLISAG
jgi:hypothetical protein